MQVIRPQVAKRPRTHNLEGHGAQSHSRKQIKKQSTRDCLFHLVAEMGFEPHDLRVMSPTSYQTAPLRDINGAGSRGRTGTRVESHGILSPGRLPIPPFRHKRPSVLLNYYIIYYSNCQAFLSLFLSYFCVDNKTTGFTHHNKCYAE